MTFLRALINPFRPWYYGLKSEAKLALVLMRFPTLRAERPSVWRYDTLRAMEIGKNVDIGRFCEIIAYSHNPRTPVAGKLILEDNVIISTGCNVRAAGGVISMAKYSGLG